MNDEYVACMKNDLHSSDQSGHRERLRQRFRAAGGVSLADHELLELLLTYAVPRKDTKPTAKALLKKHNSFSSVLEQPLSELENCDGVGPASGTLISLVRACINRYFECEKKSGTRISAPRDIAKLARTCIPATNRECLVLLCLDDDNRLGHSAVISEGTLNRLPVYPREIIKEALLHNASAIILVHSHPAATSAPSEADHRITARLDELLLELGIRFVDHLIVAPDSIFSLKTGELL